MRTLVTGGSGQVGRHLKELMPDAVYLSSKDCNLLDRESIRATLAEVNPQAVVHLAAKVGGISDNMSLPNDYFYENILMNTLLLEECRLHGVDRFIGVLSTCAYPDRLPDGAYPLDEEMLHAGPPTETNFGYGYAKRCMAVHVDAMNAQHGTRYQYLIPPNLYGPYDKFDRRSHFVGALLSKLKDSDGSITLMGDGSPLRQFIYAGDLARVIQMCLDGDVRDSFNVAPDFVHSIREIAEVALVACGKEGTSVSWTGEHNGQHRKDVSNSRMSTLFPGFEFTGLMEGIEKTWKTLCTDTGK